jgi:predicted DNA-binding antitoxin AbrB/MazE fold protein
MDNQITDAIYSGGVLKPLGKLSLHEAERVRLIIERTESTPEARRRALERLRAGIAKMHFRSSGPLPGRDDLHDRL